MSKDMKDIITQIEELRKQYGGVPVYIGKHERHNHADIIFGNFEITNMINSLQQQVEELTERNKSLERQLELLVYGDTMEV